MLAHHGTMQAARRSASASLEGLQPAAAPACGRPGDYGFDWFGDFSEPGAPGKGGVASVAFTLHGGEAHRQAPMRAASFHSQGF